MCAPWGRGFCVDLFRNVVVMWVALELSGTFAILRLMVFFASIVLSNRAYWEKWRNDSCCTQIFDLHAQMYLIELLLNNHIEFCCHCH